MIICVCKNVSERDIASAIAEGCHSFKSLQAEFELGKACGTCLETARQCFAEKKAAKGDLQAA